MHTDWQIYKHSKRQTGGPDFELKLNVHSFGQPRDLVDFTHHISTIFTPEGLKCIKVKINSEVHKAWCCQRIQGTIEQTSITVRIYQIDSIVSRRA